MYCKCGCGEKTRWKNGKPQQYVFGHTWRGRRRVSGPDYLIDPETGCWLWQHGKTPKGYGQKVLQPGNRIVAAHRWYYEQANGPIPEGRYLDHLCRVTGCVNPAHLEVVTNALNVRRGNSTRLTPKQVAEIKAAPRGYGTGRALAIKYGVADSTISAIRTGQNWSAA